MRLGSLRLRLVAAGTIALLVALGVAGFGMVVLFERHVARTLAADLDVHLRQLLNGLEVDPEGRIVVSRSPADPRFVVPLSGLYWQISDDHGQLLRSRSLWDTILPLPIDEPGPSDVHQHELAGPDGVRVLVAERGVVMNPGSQIRVRAAVAYDLDGATSAVRAFAKDLSIALAVLATILAVGTTVQVNLGLRPLAVLRRGVAEIRGGKRQHLPVEVPTEVAPLVEEVNALLDAQSREILRSRSRAADLAHGFKTPLAALTADAARLKELGQLELARNVEDVAEAMSRQVDRELALARLRGKVRGAPEAATELAPLVEALLGTLGRTPAAAHVSFDGEVPAGLRVAMDRTDLAEVLGNLLENAARHAASTVRIVARATPLSMVVEDDGPGIPAAQIGRVLERGGRLDEQGPGSGLGLAIVQDVLEAYRWRLQIGSSELGGAKITIAPAMAPALAQAPAMVAEGRRSPARDARETRSILTAG
ncbi:sensor histidine kinase [Bradyrhizobium sp. 83012]|uniref:histidine kinase n=1 Tax=Bradyrhizobium aeschynomenes TaxID=2734909 RepID=A0ABX2CHR7_9BRAD|nr:sensor histidine kinase [Bradyrhizobium aeschynomenes]NPU12502.1 sensor histidine kinase [Bradyrhizobium aeschynomenes]NPU67733.1 sensor histidine kinase [Bradyrhizobium aeschynomenes]NPV23059.1 sensor histidine kinase [Bradyrhizobium aeschynomenes]